MGWHTKEEIESVLTKFSPEEHRRLLGIFMVLDDDLAEEDYDLEEMLRKLLQGNY